MHGRQASRIQGCTFWAMAEGLNSCAVWQGAGWAVKSIDVSLNMLVLPYIRCVEISTLGSAMFSFALVARRRGCVAAPVLTESDRKLLLLIYERHEVTTTS